jgi:CheY-like chemotaxis protein
LGEGKVRGQVNLPRRILVVDDDESAIKVIRDHLMSYDFEVDDLRASTEVIDHLHNTNDYGLFIFDVNMPNKDGITLATQIRSAFKTTTPILFVSGDEDENNRTSNRIRRLGLSGIVGFLKKGKFDSRDLFNTCMGMLKEHYHLKKMDEFTGRLSDLREGLSEGMGQISSFIERFESKPLVTAGHCDAKAEAIVKAVRNEVLGIAIGKSNKNLERVMDEEVRPGLAKAMRVASEPPSPSVIAEAAEKSQTFRVLKWAVLLIGGLYGSWLGYTHFLAAEASQGVENIKTGQGYMKEMIKQQNDNIHQMQSLMKQMHTPKRSDNTGRNEG